MMIPVVSLADSLNHRLQILQASGLLSAEPDFAEVVFGMGMTSFD